MPSCKNNTGLQTHPFSLSGISRCDVHVLVSRDKEQRKCWSSVPSCLWAVCQQAIQLKREVFGRGEIMAMWL